MDKDKKAIVQRFWEMKEYLANSDKNRKAVEPVITDGDSPELSQFWIFDNADRYTEHYNPTSANEKGGIILRMCPAVSWSPN